MVEIKKPVLPTSPKNPEEQELPQQPRLRAERRQAIVRNQHENNEDEFAALIEAIQMLDNQGNQNQRN